MKRVKYKENNEPIIYIVATPIGNLSEINERLITTLNEVTYIFCEDTRVTSKLLNHLNIKDKKLESYHLHNEFDKLDRVIECVKNNGSIALVSDAGYPLISDPGEKLVSEALNNNINIVVINGSNAVLPALINSGFNTVPFTFIGFIPNKKNDAINYLNEFKEYKHSIILYESIHHLTMTLKSILDVFGNVPLAISRELTKLNEEHLYGSVEEFIYEDLILKGELVIVIDNSKASEEVIIDDVFIINEVNKLLASRMSKKDAIKKVSKQFGIEKNYVYDLVHNKDKQEN